MCYDTLSFVIANGGHRATSVTSADAGAKHPSRYVNYFAHQSNRIDCFEQHNARNMNFIIFLSKIMHGTEQWN